MEKDNKRTYGSCEDGDIKNRPSDADIAAEITEEIKNNPVIIYMQGFCGFSQRAMGLLNSLKVPFKAMDLRDDIEKREVLKSLTNWPTIPQIFVKGEFLGGCDDIHELHAVGELQRKIQAAI